MKPIGCLLSTIALIGALCPMAYGAQERLESAVIRSERPLTRSQKGEVSEYVDHWFQALESESSKDVGAAQKRLVAPMGANPTSHFVTEYREALGPRLAEPAASKRVVVRLNAMIVAAALRDPQTIPALTGRLKDDNPAVRYWAAKAIVRLSERDETDAGGSELEAPDRKRLLDALADALDNKNENDLVIQRFVAAMVNLTVDDAPQLLTALNKRVDVHYRNPQLSLTAEFQGLRDLRNRMIAAATRGRDVPEATIRLFTLVCARYIMMSASLLDAGEVPASRVAGHTQMAMLTDGNLHWLVAQLGVTNPPRETSTKIELLIKDRDWPTIKLRADAWENLLIDKLRFKPDALKISRQVASDVNR